VDETLKPIAEQLAFNGSLLSLVFTGLDDEAASMEPAPGLNSVKWLCGHAVTGRHQIMTLLGRPTPAPWDNVFEGPLVDESAVRVPSAAHVQQAVERSTRTLLSVLASANRKLLQTAPATPFPTVERTTLAAVAFLANHESYHIGQISYARRLLGFPGLIDVLTATS